MEEKFCKYCGKKIPFEAVVCVHCGKQVEELKVSKELGMKWFNFVGKFLFIIIPVLNIIMNCISIYKYASTYNDFKTDIAYFGLLSLETILWVVAPIFLFSKYLNKNKSFPLFVIIWELLTCEYLIINSIYLPGDVLSIDSPEFTNLITKILGNLIGTGINIYYFYKRLNVFNDKKGDN